jgi:hypothetical protein
MRLAKQPEKKTEDKQNTKQNKNSRSGNKQSTYQLAQAAPSKAVNLSILSQQERMIATARHTRNTRQRNCRRRQDVGIERTCD